MIDHTRVEALAEAKMAIRAYSRDPSDINAAKVEAAWQTIRTLNAVSAWRRRLPTDWEQEAPARASLGR